LKSNRSRSLNIGPIDRSYSRACVTITSSGVYFVSKQLASTSFRRQVLSTLLVQRWRGSSGNVRLSNLLISSCSIFVLQYFKSCNYMSCYFMPCVFMPCKFASCNFMSCNVDGPSFSCPSFSINPRCHVSVAYAVMRRRSLCLSRSWIASKRINISSKFCNCLVATALVFPTKRNGNIPTGTPQTAKRGHRMHVG